MPKSKTEELLTVAEVASRMRLSDRAVRRMLADGRLPRIRLRGLRAVRVPAHAVRGLVETP